MHSKRVFFFCVHKNKRKSDVMMKEIIYNST